jgi:hypothetical protein
MKKCLVAIILISLTLSSLAFIDKPALSEDERLASAFARTIGTAGGAYLGATRGYKWGKERALASMPPRVPGRREHIDSRAFAGGLAGLKTGTLGTGIAAVIGYQGVKPLTIFALAKMHGVSYRTEVISQYYDINVGQYYSILVAAANQKPEKLLQAINTVYIERFGEDWQEQLKKLFKKYRRRARILVKESSFEHGGDVKDFVRMIELGAAMANLYFETNPNKAHTANSAIEMYQELGLLK